MTTSVERSVIDFIKSNFSEIYSSKKLKVTVMVSGGLDSMVLLHVLQKYRVDINIDITAVYVDFKDFKEHEETKDLIVKKMTEYDLPVLIHTPTHYFPSKTNARIQMKSAATSVVSDVVLTAHHADDQIETFLFRTLRGAGAEGLACMSQISNYGDTIFGKPFLKMFKEDIRNYAAMEENVTYIQDTSNGDNSPDRNFIRNKLIPLLEERFDSHRILDTVNNLADQKALSKELLEAGPFRHGAVQHAGKWDIPYFLSISVLNRLAWVKYYLSKHHGFVLSKKTSQHLKTSLEGDITTLNVDITSDIKLIRKGDYIVVETNFKDHIKY